MDEKPISLMGPPNVKLCMQLKSTNKKNVKLKFYNGYSFYFLHLIDDKLEV